MERFIVVIAILCGFTTQSLAALENELAKCAAVPGELDRLQCFDDLSAANGLDKPQPQAIAISGTGKWVVRRDVNPIDDTAKVTLMLIASEGKSKWGDDIAFVARCQSNTTEAFIRWGDYLGNDGDIYNEWKSVTIRIGDQKARNERWSLSTDSQATFAPDWAGELLKKMSTETKFIAQVTPYNENPRTAIFDTTGMVEALKPLAETCGWTL